MSGSFLDVFYCLWKLPPEPPAFPYGAASFCMLILICNRNVKICNRQKEGKCTAFFKMPSGGMAGSAKRGVLTS